MYNGTDPTGYNTRLKKISVIVSVNETGRMLPLYFQYHGQTFRLDRIR